MQDEEKRKLGRDLLVEEYKSCRDLIGRNIEIIERAEVYAIGAVAAVAGFTLTAKPEVAKIACWLTVLIASLGAIRFFGIDRTIKKINNYLQKIEAAYPEIGWTTDYRRQNKIKYLKASRYAIWFVLLVSSGYFVYLVHTDVTLFAGDATKAAQAAPPSGPK